MNGETDGAKSELFNKLANLLAQEDVEDLQMAKMKLQVILDDYDVTAAEKALVPYTDGKNELLLNRFLLAKAVAGRTEKTIKQYRGTINRALSEMGRDVDKISHVDLQVFLAKVMGRTSKINARNYQRCLSSFFLWLTSEEIIPKNPMSRVEPIKTPKIQKKAFTELEIEKLRNACETLRDRAIVETLLSTGCRVSELCDIGLDKVQEGSVVIMGKGQKERTVFLNAKAQLAIEQYRAQERKDSSKKLFTAERTPSDPKVCALTSGAVEDVLRKLGRRAEVDHVHPHRFRRTCATMALRRGMSINEVSKMLGHESISTTQIYLDTDDEDLESAHRKYVVI